MGIKRGVAGDGCPRLVKKAAAIFWEMGGCFFILAEVHLVN